MNCWLPAIRVGVEDMPDEELAEMKKFFVHLTSISKKEKQNTIHTIDEEKVNRQNKKKHLKQTPFYE